MKSDRMMIMCGSTGLTLVCTLVQPHIHPHLTVWLHFYIHICIFKFLYIYVFIFYTFYIYILKDTSLRQHIFIHSYTSYICNCKKGGSFPLTNCMAFVFHSFCHKPDDGSLKLKPVAWVRFGSVCVGSDCTIDKSEIYFSMFVTVIIILKDKMCDIIFRKANQ
jgi:acetyltransferase-like isoleucine patch superfamily enzyme